MKSRVQYQSRFIAFVDLLGFKDLIYESERDPSILPRLEYAARRLTVTAPKYAGSAVDGVTQHRERGHAFSDSLVLSGPASPEGCYGLTISLVISMNLLFHAGVLARGAVVRGLLYHDDHIVVGSGLIRAHEAESTLAKYPRIIIADEFVEAWREVSDHRSDICPPIERTFLIDFDGLRHLNYLEWQPQVPMQGDENVMMSRVEWLRFVQAELAKKLSACRSVDVYAKLAWMGRYFNDVQLHYPAEVPPLVILPFPWTSDATRTDQEPR